MRQGSSSCWLGWLRGGALLPAQHDWTWTFGDSVVMRFPGGGAPVVSFAESSRNTFETGASYSDEAGNLLVFANHLGFYNKNYALVGNGGISIIDESATQGIILIPSLSPKDSIYAFYIDMANCATFISGCPTYVVISPKVNGGVGAVVNRYHLGYPGTMGGITEKLQAVKHINGRDWWVYYHDIDNNDFYRYHLSDTGITAPIRQSIGQVHGPYGNNAMYAIGEMEFSQDGKRLLVATGSGIIDIFDVDRCTGELSNWVQVSGPAMRGSNNWYGCSFSPDGNLIYATELDLPYNSRLYQWDLTFPNIPGSKLLLYHDTTNTYWGQMQNGPDGKLYITHASPDSLEPSNFALSVIHHPDWIGFACQFEYLGLSLQGMRTSFNLPNLPNYSLGPGLAQTAEAGPDRLICKGDSVLLGYPDTTAGRVGFWWSGPGLSDPHNAQSWAKPDSTAWYFLQAMDSVYGRQCGWTWDSVLVVVDSGELTVDSLPGEVLACAGDTVGFGAWGLGLGWNYQWSGGGWIGSPDSVVTLVAGAGDYVVTAVNPAGIGSCFTVRDTVRVLDYPWAAPADAAGLDGVICNGDSLRLGQGAWVMGQDWVYNWSPSAELDAADIARPLAWPRVTTAYVLVAGDTAFSGACAQVLDTVLITVGEPFTHAAPNDTTFCPGECFMIGVLSTEGYQYLWSPTVGLASQTASMTRAQPSTTATYTLTVTNPALQSANCREHRYPVTLTADDCQFQSFIAVNGDNIAEALDLGDHAGKVELKVYDVAGRLVHVDEDYRNNWSAAGLAHGVYVFRVNISGECPASYSGKVVVVR